MIPRHRTTHTFVLLLVALLAGTGIARADSTDATPTAQPTTISVYYLRAATRGDKLGAAHREMNATTIDRAAKAAMRELIQGPTKAEREAGLKSDLPKKTEVLGIELDEATKRATVNLSPDFAPEGKDLDVAHLAQVVFTLTQFPNVERVAITIEGKPLDLLDGDGKPLAGPAARTDYERLTPLIFLESPAPGDTIASPVRLWGTANTFEATFMAEVHDANGKTLAHQAVTATSGNGFRGTFDVSLSFDPKQTASGEVVVYEISARDGARDNEVAVPVEFALD
jgi:germination protein M